jgi:hypothetical protein
MMTGLLPRDRAGSSPLAQVSGFGREALAKR